MQEDLIGLVIDEDVIEGFIPQNKNQFRPWENGVLPKDPEEDGDILDFSFNSDVTQTAVSARR